MWLLCLPISKWYLPMLPIGGAESAPHLHLSDPVSCSVAPSKSTVVCLLPCGFQQPVVSAGPDSDVGTYAQQEQQPVSPNGLINANAQ